MAYGSYAHIQKLNGFEIPDRWDCRKLKFCSTCNDEIHPESMDPDTEIFYVDISSVNLSEGVIQIEAIPFEKAPSRARRRTQSGDTIVSTVRTYLKAIAYIDDRNDLTVSTGFAVLRPNQVLDSKYLSYYARSELFVGEVTSLSNGVSYPAINPITLVGIPALFPNCKKEQAQIARFLDYKTAQLDQLIAKKQALIERLNEQRIALITQAVTRGLNPDVPLKDSGVEWLGQVPEGWEVKPVKYMARILRGKFTHRPRNDPAFYDGDYPFIQTGDVSRAGKYVSDYSQTLNQKGYAVSKEFPAGTLVMTIAANIGDMAILDFNACFPDSIVGFVPDSGVELDYLYYLFVAMKKQLLSTAVLNTQLNLNIDRIGSIPGCHPHQEEQLNIVGFLEKENKRIEVTKGKISAAINRLEEYRTALITAAVTGKIDVRDIQIPVPPNDGPASENIHEKASSQA